ncbi:MAG: hypothetical protein H0U18_10880 [Pyrinomonadaceae bacterium]|nr:hypothetical protein [Pyrinomonadaceae bacterium]
MVHLTLEARQKVARGKRLARRIARPGPTNGRSKRHQNIALIVVNRATVSTSPDIQICDNLYALSGRIMLLM